MTDTLGLPEYLRNLATICRARHLPKTAARLDDAHMTIQRELRDQLEREQHPSAAHREAR